MEYVSHSEFNKYLNTLITIDVVHPNMKPFNLIISYIDKTMPTFLE